MSKEKFSLIKRLKEVSPIRLIVFSFLAIIIVGTILLIFPFSSRSQQFTPPLDALFTATSATCVTGLAVYDTWTHWSDLGQGIILSLIQLGGLGLVTFTTGFTLLLRRKLGLRDMQLAKEYTNGSVMDTPRLLRTILLFTFAFETIGALLLAIRFVPQFGSYGIWLSIFTSVSADCNAGFDIMGFTTPYVGLTGYVHDPLVSLTVSALIALGGLGFLVYSDIYLWLQKKRKGIEKHPHLTVHSSVVLRTTLALIVIGTVLFLFLEYNHSLAGMNIFQKIHASLFQSVSARTAGFSTINVADQYDSTKLMTIVLMFIGASPASTGGGIKTTTFVVLISTIISVLRGRDETMIMKRRVDKSIVYRALTIAILALLLICITSGIMMVVEPDGLSAVDVLFEAVSAFGTVGLSAGITPDLGALSKIMLSFTMFVGRVGPISLILALSAHQGNGRNSQETVAPDARIVVG